MQLMMQRMASRLLWHLRPANSIEEIDSATVPSRRAAIAPSCEFHFFDIMRVDDYTRRGAIRNLQG